jgi:hypothetical protein
MVSFIGLGPSTFRQWAMTDMVLLRMHPRERPSTTSADIPNLFQMNLIYMSSVTALLEDARASGPRTFHFLPTVLYNGETQLLVAAG